MTGVIPFDLSISNDFYVHQQAQQQCSVGDKDDVDGPSEIGQNTIALLMSSAEQNNSDLLLQTKLT